jgi:hypothetical protein
LEAEKKKYPQYIAAVNTLRSNSLMTSKPEDLMKSSQEAVRCYPDIHKVSSSKAVARLHFYGAWCEQKAMTWVADQVLPKDDPKRIVAWGGAHWAHGLKGVAPCSAFKIYRKIAALPRATAMLKDHQKQEFRGTRLPRESEFKSSVVCSACLGEAKMEHPVHDHFMKKKRIYNPTSGFWERQVIECSGEHVYDLFQCAAKGCCRTHGRDLNGASNILRTAWERSHGRPRPASLARPQEHGGAAAKGKKKTRPKRASLRAQKASSPSRGRLVHATQRKL